MTSENRSANVALALEMLLEEVAKEIGFVNRDGANAFASGDHGVARKSLQRSEVLTAFRDKVAVLRKEWQEHAVSVDRSENEEVSTRRSNGRLPRGQRTPEAEFVVPILQVLEKMGGSGEGDEIVERVGWIMKPILREVDCEPLKGDGKPRWQKAVHWARFNMVKDGLLKPNFRRGMWEISESGRDSLS